MMNNLSVKICFSSFCTWLQHLFLAFIFFLLFLYLANSLFCCNLFELFLHLSYSFIVNWFIDFGDQRLVSQHTLDKLDVWNAFSRQVLGGITDQNQCLAFDNFFGISFCKQNLHNSFNWWLRKRACLKSLNKIINGAVNQKEGDLFFRVESGFTLGFLEYSFDVIHELFVVEENTNGRLQLTEVKLFQ